MTLFNWETTLNMQRELHRKYEKQWGPLSYHNGRDQLLWMTIEAMEMADIIKKDKDEKILNDPDVRRHFIEEMCDTLMYLNDVMLCYEITPQELAAVYLDKHQRNMQRW